MFFIKSLFYLNKLFNYIVKCYVLQCNLWIYAAFGLPNYCSHKSTRLCQVCKVCRNLYNVFCYLFRVCITASVEIWH